MITAYETQKQRNTIYNNNSPTLPHIDVIYDGAQKANAGDLIRNIHHSGANLETKL